MTTEVDVCNLALGNLLQSSISELSDSSRQAQICNLWYDLTRDQVLSDFDWNFNRKIRALSLIDEEVFNWSYVYQYPADCLRISLIIPNVEVYSQSDSSVTPRSRFEKLPDIDKIQVPYEVMVGEDDGKIIVANYDDLRIKYRAKVENPAKFTPLFITALSYLLSANMAVPIVGADKGRPLREDNMKLYSALIREAAANSENEGYQAPQESDVISIRD